MSSDKQDYPIISRMRREFWAIPPQLHSHKWPRIAAAIVGLIGGLVLIGWALDIAFLKSILPGMATMKANSALSFLLAGVALWMLSNEQPVPSQRRLAQIFALIILLIGTLTLAEYFLGWDFGIDQLLFKDSVISPGVLYAGRMAHATALNFVLLGLTLWLLSYSQRYNLMQLLTLVMMLISLLVLAGHLYGVEALHSFFTLTSGAFHTALTFFIAGTGILLAHPERGWMASITSKYGGGEMACRLLPAVILLPLIYGWLRLKGQQLGYYNTEFGLALFALANIFTFSLLVWWNSRSLNKIDVERKNAETALLEQETRYHRILDSLMEGAQIIGYDWRYLYINDAAAQQGQQPKETLLGYTIMEKYPGIENTEMYAILRRAMHERIPQQMENEFGYANGNRSWFQLIIQPVDEGIFVLSLDITERKKQDVHLKRYGQRMEMLHAIDIGLIQGSSIDTLIETTLKHLRKLIPCQRATVAVLDPDTGEGIIFANDMDSDTALGEGVRVPATPSGLEGLDSRHMRIIDDIRLLKDLNPQAKQLVKEGMISSLEIILMEQAHPTGSLGLLANTPAFFTAEHQDIAHQVASQLALALHQLHLNEKVVSHVQTVEETRQFLQTTFDAFPANAAVLDGDGAILAVNAAWKRFADENGAPTHYPDANYLMVCDKAVGDNSEEAASAAAGVRAVIAGQQDNFYLEYPCHSSTQQRWFGVRVTPFEEPSPRRVVVAHINITERKRAEAALQESYATLEQRIVERTTDLIESETKFQRLLDAAPMATIITDDRGHITLINIEAENLFGYTRDELIGQPVEILIPENARDRHIHNRDGYMAAPRVRQMGYGLELFALHKDGTQFPVEIELSYIQMQAGLLVMSFVVNIAGRKERERQLRYQASLQANVTDAVISTDLNFVIQTWNRAAEKIYGWRVEEAVGKPVELLQTQFMTSESAERVRQEFLNQGYWTDEVIQHHKNGSPIYILSSAVLFKDENERPLGVVAVNHNITERKKAEIALRESEARYRLLAENVTDVVVRSNATGEYLYVSPSSRSVLGYEPTELIGQSTFNDIHPDDLRASTEALLSATDQNLNMIIRFRHKQGHYIWMETIGVPIRSETGQIEGLITSSRDISDRKRAEDALRDSEEKFRLLLDAAPIATVISDSMGRIILVNIQAEQLFGYNRDELVGQMVEVLVPQYAHDLHVHNRNAYLAAPRVRQMGIGLELFAKRKDTSEFPVEIELSYIETKDGIMVMSFVVDITERKRVAAELEGQRSFLQSVIDFSPSMIFVKDYNSRFILANPMMAKMYDTTVEALIGKTDADFNPMLNEAGDFIKADQRVINSGEPLFVEEPITNSNGEVRWLQTTKVPVISPDGKSKYVLGVATDTTERKRAEDALRQALAKEKELGELKTRFVSMASHEFRTPLATILAMTETLSAYRHKLSEEQIEMRLSKIREQIDYLKDIMDDVLLLARMQARRVEFNPVRLNLDDLCRSVIDEFQSRADIKHPMIYSCDERLREVILDKKLMRQIVNNLVSNAIKYSPPDKTIWVSLIYKDDSFVLKIRDEGIGIPEADMKHLFEPFHRADNVGTTSGTGLGLVITKESVELHGGTISVESQIGVGTAFTVSIPLTNKGETKHDENTGY